MTAAPASHGAARHVRRLTASFERTSSRSLRRSIALWYRRDGSLARQRRRMRSSSFGRFGLLSESGDGVSFMIDEITDTAVSPLNGRVPVTISYITTPRENTSDRAST